MKLKPNFDTDLLNRQKSIERLSNLLKNIEEPYTVAINGDWGTGKTTFIKLWEEYLKTQQLKDVNNKEIVSIYFNAWDNDFETDPLIAFIDTILDSENINSKFINLNALKKTFTEQLLPNIGGIIAGGLTSLILKNFNNLSSLAKDSVKESANLYQDYQKRKHQLKIFKKTFENIMNDSKYKIVIFVDELDRCRPTYAIELLERIKHFFNINNVVFVLSMNKEQLQHSIKAVYGSEFDAHHYLKRFIDTEFELKTFNKLMDHKDTDLTTYLETMLKQLEFDKLSNLNKSDYQHFKEYLLVFCVNFGLSLRQIEQAIGLSKIILSNLISDKKFDKQYFFTPFIFILALKQVNYNLLKIFLNEKINLDELFLELVNKYDGYHVHIKKYPTPFLIVYTYLYFLKYKQDKNKMKELYTKTTYSFNDVEFIPAQTEPFADEQLIKQFGWSNIINLSYVDDLINFKI